jgi:hypothetical protein
MRQPADEFLKPAQAARRFGQIRFTPRDLTASRGVAARQIETGGAQRRK